MIAETNAKKYCKEDISLIENYAEALADTTQMWLCHHRNAEPFTGFSRDDLKKMNMLYNRPASELKFVTPKEHIQIHSPHASSSGRTGKTNSAEHNAAISKANKGRKFSAEHRAKLSAAKKGKKLSAETKAKMSTSHIGHIVTQETRAKISATEKITKSRDKLCQN